MNNNKSIYGNVSFKRAENAFCCTVNPEVKLVKATVDQQPISVEKEEEEDDLLALLHCISP
jgi:hypothetical protein